MPQSTFFGHNLFVALIKSLRRAHTAAAVTVIAAAVYACLMPEDIAWVVLTGQLCNVVEAEPQCAFDINPPLGFVLALFYRTKYGLVFHSYFLRL
jgi:hypothetical protein